MKIIVCKTCKVPVLELCSHYKKNTFGSLGFGDIFCADNKCQDNYKSTQGYQIHRAKCDICKEVEIICQYGGEISIQDIEININSLECKCVHYCKSYYKDGGRSCKIRKIKQ